MYGESVEILLQALEARTSRRRQKAMWKDFKAILACPEKRAYIAFLSDTYPFDRKIHCHRQVGVALEDACSCLENVTVSR